MSIVTVPTGKLIHNYYTNQVLPCEMNLITQKVAKFISNRFIGDYSIVDLTWFNQYDESINHINSDYVVAIDVADPPYFLKEKISWIKQLNKPVIFVGPPTNEFPVVVPFLAWLRFRSQKYTPKESSDNFFVSFNRKPHSHRVLYFNQLKKYDLLEKGIISYHDIDPLHEIHSLDLDYDIVRLQELAQQIDEKQLYSSFEIICETSPSNSHIFLTEKFNKCIASETPLFLAGCYGSLHTLKTYYGFTDFGPDDSYDLLPTYEQRVIKMLATANSFFDYPINSVFDNAKKNAYHLFNHFDTIHDSIVDKYIEKSINYVKNCNSNGTSF